MSNLISDCILTKSFTRFGYKFVIRNETSHTSFNKAELISIKELKEDGLSFELPINICQKGHSLTLFFTNPQSNAVLNIPLSGSLKEAKFEVMVKVTNVATNKTNKELVFVDVHFTQYDVDTWKKIINENLKNQEEINKMIMKQHAIRDEE